MPEEPSIQFVDLPSARAARGVRMLALTALPSPWSEAVKGMFRVTGMPVKAVRFKRGDPDQMAWVGVRNAPAVVFDDDPPRTGWAETIRLADRLGGAGSLIPLDTDQRVRLFGLVHELAGEDGLGWCGRLLMVHGSLESGGAQSFPLRLAESLARDYGYSAARAEGAPARIAEVMRLLDGLLARSHAAGHAYLLGERLTALDVYAATFLTPIVGVTEAECPAMLPVLRPAFAYLHDRLGGAVPPPLAAHRRFLLERHLGLPIVL